MRLGLVLKTQKAVVLTLVAAVFLLSVWHNTFNWWDLRNRHPPGTIISAVGAGLHVFCRGTGPLVWFDGGLGATYLEFQDIQLAISNQVRACAYDRAGLGWSTARSGTRSAQREASELLALAEIVAPGEPMVLVAHSYGALIAQAVCVTAPERVAALVLIDPSYPEEVQLEHLPPLTLARAIPVIAPLGVLHLRGLFAPPDHAWPTEIRAEEEALTNRTSHMLSFAREIEAIPESSAVLRAKPPVLPGNPVLILGRDGNPVRERYQRQLAAMSSHGKFQVVPGTGHFIHVDAPNEVVRAILESLGLAAAASNPQNNK